jgi:hypothetical protein
MNVHIGLDDQKSFTQDEINEIILIAYNMIEAAIYAGSDILIVSFNHFAWRKGNLDIGQVTMSDAKRTMSFQAAVKKILERDEFARTHMHIVSETPDQLVVHIDVEPPS